MRFFNGLQKMGKDGRVRWALMRSFDIPCGFDEQGGDLLYLRRLRIVQTPFGGIYLHQINEPDKDYDPHDHPFNFVSVILKGGYDEIVGDPHKWWQAQTVWRNRWSVHRMPITQAHRILNLHQSPTWTLVLVGPRHREWGFWRRTGSGSPIFIPWQNYHEVSDGQRRV